jgi:hypothetical protein
MNQDKLNETWNALVKRLDEEGNEHDFRKVYADAARDENGKLTQTGNGHAAVQAYVQQNLDWSAAETALGSSVSAEFKDRAFFSGVRYTTGNIHCGITVDGQKHWGYAIYDTNTLLVIGWNGGESSPGSSNTVAFSQDHITPNKWNKHGGSIGSHGLSFEDPRAMFNKEYTDKEAKRKPFKYEPWMH